MKRLTRYSEKTATRGKIYIFMCANVERVFNNYHILTSAQYLSRIREGPVIRFEVVTLKTR